MPGRKTEYDMTYLTALSVYRSEILAADADVYSDDIPTMRLDIDACKQAIDPAAKYAPKHEVSARAYNGHMELYVSYDPDPTGGNCVQSQAGIINGLLSQDDQRCHADVRVWAWADPLDRSLEGRWCLVHEQSVVMDTLVVLRNIPNTAYKVTVDFMTSGRVDIMEQHTV
jgi:hypothetical protein